MYKLIRTAFTNPVASRILNVAVLLQFFLSAIGVKYPAFFESARPFNLLLSFVAPLVIIWPLLKGVAERRCQRLVQRSYPPNAEKLLDLFLPPAVAEEAIDNINAQFERRRERYGLAHARRWYWWQVLRSVVSGLKEAIELAFKVSGK